MNLKNMMKSGMQAVILAGGKGTRLAPYTTVFPKPLMPIGEMPILEVVLLQLKYYGIKRVTLAVGHLAELIKTFFGDGRKLGLDIKYSLEDVPLGTVGPLTLLDDLEETFLLMNGDVLTTLNFRDLIDFHKRKKGIATIATKIRTVNIDFGIVKMDNSCELTDYIEKPSMEYHVSMGIYVFRSKILKYLKKGEYFDFPNLIRKLIASGERVVSYPFEGYWLDIGRPEDFQKAGEEFDLRKKEFLPGVKA